MKRMIAGAALAAVVLAGCSQSNSPNGQQQQQAAAQPRVECTKERVVHKKEWGTGGVAGTVIGGAAGGLLGNQFGKGSGNAAMTALGAVGGAIAGANIGSRYPQSAQNCQQVTSYTTQAYTQFDVTYVWRGATYHTRMNHDPGPYFYVNQARGY